MGKNQDSEVKSDGYHAVEASALLHSRRQISFAVAA
jgi:hypothetical protein